MIVLSLAYAILYAWAWIDTATAPMDTAGRGMTFGFLTVGVGITALFVIPALILALRDKALKWALGLALTPAALLVLISLSGTI
ncbi:hypothetical protein ACFORG_12730 [Lutimaribacter marinistellae]|uniref:Major facilitator superfamily (MFS) profile domain-containing protein n=1 Tax=Lutimaribacter marinistellae TaxID=1820329 RepID=A0ABV7TH36_9RHOB